MALFSNRNNRFQLRSLLLPSMGLELVVSSGIGYGEWAQDKMIKDSI